MAWSYSLKVPCDQVIEEAAKKLDDLQNPDEITDHAVLLLALTELLARFPDNPICRVNIGGGDKRLSIMIKGT